MKQLRDFIKPIKLGTISHPGLVNIIFGKQILLSDDFLYFQLANDKNISGGFPIEKIKSILNLVDFNKKYEMTSTETTLSIEQGNSRYYCRRISNDTPYPCFIQETYETEPFNPQLIDLFQFGHLFVGIDASRQWSLGFHILNNHLFCSNNIVVIGAVLPFTIEDKFIPKKLTEYIVYLSKLGYHPSEWIFNDAVIGVKYNNGIVFSRKSADITDLSTPLVDDSQNEWIQITPEFKDDVLKLSKSNEMVIHIQDNLIQTDIGDDGIKIETNLHTSTQCAYIMTYFTELVRHSSLIKFDDKKALLYTTLNNFQIYSAIARYSI